MGTITSNFSPDLPRISLLAQYRLRIRRKRWLWRAFRARHDLSWVSGDPRARHGDVAVFMCLRNEMARLPHFLDYYRARGVQQFYVIDNASDDGSRALLEAAPDVVLWHTAASYKQSRFGIDWVNWLLTRYGAGRWCLTLDADELLVFPEQDQWDIPALTRQLDQRQIPAYGAFMLDMFSQDPLGQGDPQADPLAQLQWFDAQAYRQVRQSPMGNLWLQGGTRERVFFADTPQQAPTLNKLPLVKWRRGMVYVNSTHAMLPRGMNAAYDGPGGARACGVLLHTKFLPEFVARSAQERQRAQHFHTPAQFASYYDQIETCPQLWCLQSLRYEGAKQLQDLGLATPLD